MNREPCSPENKKIVSLNPAKVQVITEDKNYVAQSSKSKHSICDFLFV